jgi:hypothetical protein
MSLSDEEILAGNKAPIHKVEGVYYWEVGLDDYILDPSPSPFTNSTAPKIRESWMGPLPSEEGEITDE